MNHITEVHQAHDVVAASEGTVESLEQEAVAT
jgi:hypothetical protein